MMESYYFVYSFPPEVLFDVAEFVFVSKEYAMQFGCTTMTDAVQILLKKCRPG